PILTLFPPHSSQKRHLFTLFSHFFCQYHVFSVYLQIEIVKRNQTNLYKQSIKMSMSTATINIPVTIPAGAAIDMEKMKAQLTEFALTLLHTDGQKKATQQDSPYESAFVRSLGRPVDFSDIPDERVAYRKYLEEKYK
ncbi:MAG: hypothetical protein K2J84_03785, partial [Bacteroidaceae bacterium]|nr:hypothetical protein [Bacteroidaceae bacterium]